MSKRPQIPKRVIEALEACRNSEPADGDKYPGLRGIACRCNRLYAADGTIAAAVEFDEPLGREGVFTDRDLEEHFEGAFPIVEPCFEPAEDAQTVYLNGDLLLKAAQVLASVRNKTDAEQIVELMVGGRHDRVVMGTGETGSVRTAVVAMMPVIVEEEAT
ncbi:MAG: hypothetical protein PVH68_05600 [Armatimonadota bacterium]